MRRHGYVRAPAVDCKSYSVQAFSSALDKIVPPSRCVQTDLKGVCAQSMLPRFFGYIHGVAEKSFGPDGLGKISMLSQGSVNLLVVSAVDVAKSLGVSSENHNAASCRLHRRTGAACK